MCVVQWMKEKGGEQPASTSTPQPTSDRLAVQHATPLTIREELRQLEDMVAAQAKQSAEQRQQTESLTELCRQILHSVRIPAAPELVAAAQVSAPLAPISAQDSAVAAETE